MKRTTKTSKEDRAKQLRSVIQDEVSTAVRSALGGAQATDHMGRILGSAVGGPVIRTQQKPPEPGIGAARMIRLIGASKGDFERATKLASRVQDTIWKDDLGDAVVRAMQAGSEEDGGFLIDPEFSNEIIELLRNRTVFRRAGPQMVDMPTGTMSIRKQTAGTSASYVGESRPIPTSQGKGGHVHLVAKKLTSLVPTSNELLQFSAASNNRADTFIRNDIIRELAIREDQAFLRDAGTENTPKGLRHWAIASHVTGSNGSTPANIEADFTEMWEQLEAANIPMDSLVWFMSPITKTRLFTKREGAGGQLLFPDIRGANPQVWDLPVFSTNNIPSNLGGGSDESEIYLVDMAQAILGESGSLVIDVDPSASYTENGVLVSAFERDETLIRAKTKHDLVMRHDEAISIKTGVNY